MSPPCSTGVSTVVNPARRARGKPSEVETQSPSGTLIGDSCGPRASSVAVASQDGVRERCRKACYSACPRGAASVLVGSRISVGSRAARFHRGPGRTSRAPSRARAPRALRPDRCCFESGPLPRHRQDLISALGARKAIATVHAACSRARQGAALPRWLLRDVRRSGTPGQRTVVSPGTVSQYRSQCRESVSRAESGEPADAACATTRATRE